MAFASTGFLIFLLVGVIVYYLIPKKFQWIWLLILSYYFYMCSGVKTLGLIITTTITTFLGQWPLAYRMVFLPISGFVP